MQFLQIFCYLLCFSGLGCRTACGNESIVVAPANVGSDAAFLGFLSCFDGSGWCVMPRTSCSSLSTSRGCCWVFTCRAF